MRGICKMNIGLGDFVVVKTNAPSAQWQTIVNKLNWPNANYHEISTHSISHNIHIAWCGDTNVSKHDALTVVELSLVIGDTTINDFIKRGQSGFIGKFVRVDIDNASNIQAYTDATRQIPLYWLSNDKIQAVATDLRLLTHLPNVNAEINNESIYHHLNFSYIPTPYTIYKDIWKLAPGSVVSLATKTTHRYWKPTYDDSLSSQQEDNLVNQLEEKIIDTVSQYNNFGSDNYGCFLSGGTDSSAITGILANSAGANNLNAYSIGFDEDKFDELEYAEIAANAFGINHHTLRIGAEDSISIIDSLVNSFDEPFGNSSAIPTYFCAKLASDGHRNIMVAGDGGDEIFGGNERYAKDYYFQKYYNLPSVVKMFGQLVRLGLGPVDNRFINRIKNFLYRASLPNPERFYTDDSFASEYFDQLLTDEFRRSVSKSSSLDILHTHYSECNSTSELNKIMYIDLQMAISDNDLTKVNRSAKAAGVSVLYPYLTADLIQYMGKIPPTYKVRGNDKRYLYKKAVAKILPLEIIKKKKQGFGLPVGEWFKHDSSFNELLNDSLGSQRFKSRGYFNTGFIDTIIQRHQKNTWDYTQELWLILMLELWHQKYVDH